MKADQEPRFVWFGQFLGYVQNMHHDGSVTAYFHDSIGGPGYLIRLWRGEWKAAP